MTPYYERDGITIYCGDCLEVMPGLTPPVDGIFADLPYGTTACEWDSVIPFEPLWMNYKRLIKLAGAVVLFGSEPFSSLLRTSNLGWYKYDWVWDKALPTDFLNAQNKPLKRHENILIFSSGTTANGSNNKMIYNPQMWQSEAYLKTRNKDPRIGAWERGKRTPFELRPIISDGERYPVTILEYSNADRVNKLHPTQKPVALMSYLIRTYTNPGELILDNTMGSGTTLVAAQNEGRRAIGIEISEDYCRIAVDRLRQPSFFSLPIMQPKVSEAKQQSFDEL